MAFELMPLPFPKDSLGPTTSARTLDHHHGKHHATYVAKLNEFIAGTPLEKQDLESIIKATANKTGTEHQDLQQRRAGLEPRLLLELARAERRRARAGADRSAWKPPSARSKISATSSSKQPSASSAAAGPGWSRRTASSRSP